MHRHPVCNDILASNPRSPHSLPSPCDRPLSLILTQHPFIIWLPLPFISCTTLFPFYPYILQFFLFCFFLVFFFYPWYGLLPRQLGFFNTSWFIVKFFSLLCFVPFKIVVMFIDSLHSLFFPLLCILFSPLLSLSPFCLFFFCVCYMFFSSFISDLSVLLSPRLSLVVAGMARRPTRPWAGPLPRKSSVRHTITSNSK